MKRRVDGMVSDQCNVCYDIIGGKRGWGGRASQEEDEWFEGLEERKAEMKKRGRI